MRLNVKGIIKSTQKCSVRFIATEVLARRLQTRHLPAVGLFNKGYNNLNQYVVKFLHSLIAFNAFTLWLIFAGKLNLYALVCCFFNELLV